MQKATQSPGCRSCCHAGLQHPAASGNTRCWVSRQPDNLVTWAVQTPHTPQPSWKMTSGTSSMCKAYGMASSPILADMHTNSRKRKQASVPKLQNNCTRVEQQTINKFCLMCWKQPCSGQAHMKRVEPSNHISTTAADIHPAAELKVHRDKSIGRTRLLHYTNPQDSAQC